MPFLSGGACTLPAMAERAARPLIGIEDLAVPEWARTMQVAAEAGVLAVARSVPRTAMSLTRWAWRAAPGWTLRIADSRRFA